MPREASPQARSLNGLFGPRVSSRSLGPEPWTRTSAGNGPSPLGTVSVPGSAHSPAPTVTPAPRSGRVGVFRRLVDGRRSRRARTGTRRSSVLVEDDPGVERRLLEFARDQDDVVGPSFSRRAAACFLNAPTSAWNATSRRLGQLVRARDLEHGLVEVAAAARKSLLSRAATKARALVIRPRLRRRAPAAAGRGRPRRRPSSRRVPTSARWPKSRLTS